MRSRSKRCELQEARDIVAEVMSRGAFLLMYGDRVWIYNNRQVSRELRLKASRLRRLTQYGLDMRAQKFSGPPHKAGTKKPEARMDAPTRRTTFRSMLRGHITAILLAHVPALAERAARDMAVVVLQLMKAASALSDEEDLPGRATGLRELQALAVYYVQQRGRVRAG